MIGWLFESPLAVGSMAPDFELRDSEGNLVRLSEFRGRKGVVLVWYPGDDTNICTKQLCEFKNEWASVDAQSTAVFGVNPQNAASHERFKQKYSFPFPLLVDEGQRVGKLYQTYGWIVRRTVYRIDREGIIRFARRGTPSVAEVLGVAG
jgi:thioredoxin-dependent peroxiredoxin